MTVYSETRRQIVHIGMAAFALALRLLTWPQAAALAVVALLFNVLLLPWLAPSIVRPSDRVAARAGIIFYPLAVLLLVLAFRERLELAAMAWAVLAFGDGTATLVGRSLNGPSLAWNREKTWSGLIGGFIAGAIGAAAIGSWVAPAVHPTFPASFIIASAVAAAVAGSLAETIAIRLDDNVTVPFAAAVTLALASTIAWGVGAETERLARDRLSIALAINAVLGALAWRQGSISAAGAIAGAMIGVVIYLGAGLPGWLMLFASFIAAVVSTRLGRARKQLLDIAEERGGRRGPGNAIANCLVGAIGAWLMLTPGPSWGPIVLVTGLIAGASDTVASEIGKAWGGLPRIFPSFRPSAPGAPGGVTVLGTVAGLAAAGVMGLVAFSVGLISPLAIMVVVIAATIGAFAESALAARFEPSGVLNNDVLNFLNTAFAAAAAVAIAGALNVER